MIFKRKGNKGSSLISSIYSGGVDEDWSKPVIDSNVYKIRALFYAILVTNIQDALTPLPHKHGGMPSRRDILDARHWLTRRSKHLAVICDAADLSIHYVMRNVISRLPKIEELDND